MKIALEAINYGGRLFMPGEKVTGYIDLEMLNALEENEKVGDWVQNEEELTNEKSQPLTQDEFNQLVAADQKELLKSFGVDPASKEDERVGQYAECLKQVKGDEL